MARRIAFAIVIVASALARAACATRARPPTPPRQAALAMRLLVLLVAFACGNGAPPPVDAPMPIDAAVPDAPVLTCNPVIGNGGGCGSSNRCSYVHDGAAEFDDAVLTCGNIGGTVPLGGSCTPIIGAFDDCEPNLVCRIDTCVDFCIEGSDQCLEGFCAWGEYGCYAACNPVAPLCPTGWQCYLPHRADVEEPGCAPIGTLALGDLCTYSEECGAGLTCLDETSRCAEICIVAGPPCGVGTCTPRNVGDPYGVCLP